MSVKAVQPDPEPPRVTLDDLTAAETAMAERKAGQSIATLGNENFPQVGLIGALGWIVHRRHDQRMTFDAYMASRTVNEITRELGLGDDDDEADDEGEGEGKGPA